MNYKQNYWQNMIKDVARVQPNIVSFTHLHLQLQVYGATTIWPNFILRLDLIHRRTYPPPIPLPLSGMLCFCVKMASKYHRPMVILLISTIMWRNYLYYHFYKLMGSYGSRTTTVSGINKNDNNYCDHYYTNKTHHRVACNPILK